MSFFNQSQSTFRTMFSNDENSSSTNNTRPQQTNNNTRPKMPKIDIDLGDPLRVLTSLFTTKSSSNVKSCCENCSVKFGLIKSKKICNSCKFEFCSTCFKLETDLGIGSSVRSSVCLKCRVFSKRPLKKEDLNKLKIKELKWFLRSHRISSNLCKEKSDLVDLIIQNYGLRNAQTTTNQAGPSSRDFSSSSSTTNNSNRSASQNTSPLRSATLNNLNNNNSDSSNESSQLESDWEFVNERSISDSNNNLNNTTNVLSTDNRTATTATTTNINSTINEQQQQPQPPTSNGDLNSEFVNLTNATTGDGDESNQRNELNSNDINFTLIGDTTPTSTNHQTTDLNQDNSNIRSFSQMSCDDFIDNNRNTNDNRENTRFINESSSSQFNFDENNSRSTNSTNVTNTTTTNNTTTTTTQSRMTNSNITNLKQSNNLSASNESINGCCKNSTNFNIADLASEDEIRNLSVRQLKLVLTRNYVNYKGVVEKDELQEKAIRLWRQIKQDNELFDDTKDEDLCKICMENVINCVLLECGHLVTCLDCGKRLSECPVCRQYVVRALRTFKS